MNVKEKLYYLIKEYRKGNYITSTFCEQFTVIYANERPKARFDEKEAEVFKRLFEVTSRYSEFNDDIKKYPGFYRTEKEVRAIVEDGYNDLN